MTGAWRCSKMPLLQPALEIRLDFAEWVTGNRSPTPHTRLLSE